jgi:predicted nucleic acid-binding protein
MPDACALAVAVGNDIPLITFDKRLAAEAKKRGLFEPVPA